MNRFIGVAIALCSGLATAPAAAAQFDLTRQLIQIGNDVAAVLNHVNQYTALTDQFIHLDCAGQGMTATASSTPAAGAAVICSGLNAAGAFEETYRSLASTPALLGTVLPARDWRAVLAEADTVSEADIRAIYATSPEAGERAGAAFTARRATADRGVVLAHTRADAARELTSALNAAETAADDLEARSPVTATGLGQTRVAITLARAQLLAALARHKAHEAGVAAADASAAELARRGMEAERLARRTALEAEWAADRAAMAASRAGRLESLYGGFPSTVFGVINTLLFQVFLCIMALLLLALYAVTMAQVMWAQIALAMLLILGPMFIPFLLIEPLAFLFWGWFKALWTYSLYGAIAAAIMRVFLGVSLGYINVIMTTGSGANDFWEAVAWTIALLPLMVAGILSALMVGSLAAQLVGGGGGGGGGLMGLAQSAGQAAASKGTHLAKAAG